MWLTWVKNLLNGWTWQRAAMVLVGVIAMLYKPTDPIVNHVVDVIGGIISGGGLLPIPGHGPIIKS